MKKILIPVLLLAGMLVLSMLISCSSEQASDAIYSPDGNLALSVTLKDGQPQYQLAYKGQTVVAPSALGMVFAQGDTLTASLQKVSESTELVDESWEQVWGDQKTVENNYRSYKVSYQSTRSDAREINLEFRVFNDGVGFRYLIPEQANLHDFVIMDELTEFNMTANHDAWWIPAYKDNRLEYYFTKSPINSLDTVHTPLTMECKNGMHISIHEAALTEYAGMTLAAKGNNQLECDLAPWSDGTKVKASTPLKTPWRTLTITPDAAGLITSHLIVNLNEPNKLEDLSYVKPTKYLGIWWGMHIGKYTFWESPKHGASTKNSITYIDYCKKLGIPNLLIEGWNVGWTPAWYENLMHVFSFTQSTADFDFKKVTDYARDKDVKIIGYHETGSNIDNYLAQIDEAMQMYHDAGIISNKIGQVGSRLMLKEWHYGQYGVAYYDDVLAKCAEYKMTVNFHEPIKPTGRHRTYPHWLASEGGCGQEYNAWSEGNPPEHTVILPFTRMLGGPMDFTPGIFGIKATRVHTTLAKQLALYVNFCSPLQMLADLPENYDGHPAFKFMQDVPLNWEETKVLNAKIGDYYTVVRKDIDSDDWYLGSITDENARDFSFPLDFLEEGKTYRAAIYADAADAEYDVNPEAYEILSKEVDSHTVLPIHLAKGGGQAIRFEALE